MLGLRILSAVILAPIALGAAWAGSWAFVALAVVAVCLLAWEWTRLSQGHFGLGGAVLAGGATVAAVLGKAGPGAALAVVVLAAIVAPLVERRRVGSPWWLAGGAFYIGLPAFSLVWVREQGRGTLIWLLLVVWATDIGAYVAGRTIGGPKLMPRVSPKKTWAGLVGGALSAALVGALTALVIGDEAPSGAMLAITSAALAVAAQAGDLAESWMKRYFGVKDSSKIIPGHGGVMDRLDGLLAAAPVVAVLCLFLEGFRWR